MLVNGRKASRMAKANLYSKILMLMKATGKMVKCMVMVSMKLLEIRFQANGNMGI